jgi:hypothetical protein
MTDAATLPERRAEGPGPPGSPPESDDAAALVGFLATRDVPCPLCGYNLHALLEPRCPECGRELVLSVGLAEPMLKAWITMTTALLLPAGIGLLFAAMLVHAGPPPRNQWKIAAIIFFFIAHIPAAAAAIGWRRRFLKLSPTAQWRWAAGAVASSAAAFVLFVTQAR